MSKKTILVTGGAGFIGSNFVIDWVSGGLGRVINLDVLTYAGNKNNLMEIEKSEDHVFIQGDICDQSLVKNLLNEHKPDAIVHFAAESHVDRSITGPDAFINTNIFGTFSLLEAARSYYDSLFDKTKFRFLHVSTDEVFGSLEQTDPAFSETTPYQPNSPYSASKAGSDHLVRAWHHTYGLPVVMTNCSNNYGPYHFPEKLIPLIITHALDGKLLPIYGDGKNIRDWLYVKDHCSAIRTVLEKGRLGESYNVGGNNEKTNIEIVKFICSILDSKEPAAKRGLKHPVSGEILSSYSDLISFVNDRLGHDKRYAIDATKIQKELNWFPQESFETGIVKTVDWYLNNQNWVNAIKDGSYKK